MRRMSPARRGPLETMAGLGLAGSVLTVLMLMLMVVLMVLGGCTGSDPAPAPTSAHPGTAATPTTTTPTADPTDVAAAAAIAAVKKLYAELNGSLSSGETTRYRSAFSRECALCVGNANTIDAIHKKRQHIHGGRFYVSQLVVVWNKPDRIIVQGLLHSDPLAVLAGSRVVARDSGSPPTAFTWDVKPVGHAWTISAVEVLK